MKKLIYLFIALISFCKFSQAQSNRGTFNTGTGMVFLSYEVAIPANGNFISSTSWSGLRFDSRIMITPNVSVGAAVSFNAFDQYVSQQTYQRADGTGAVTGDMIRHVYTSPITVNAHYYLPGTMIKPYLGINIGIEYSTQNVYFNIYNVRYQNWGFVARPEFGLLTKFNREVAGYASVAYNYSTNSNGDLNIRNLTHVPINIGVVFTPD